MSAQPSHRSNGRIILGSSVSLDNASSDDSVAAITQAIAGDDRFRLLQMSENYGQLGQALQILAY